MRKIFQKLKGKLNLKEKVRKLEEVLSRQGKVIVAFSGGVDSTFLLKKALDVLGKDNVVAFTAKSEVLPREDFEMALKIVKKLGVKHKIVPKNELRNPHFTANEADRCYHCKKELFYLLKKLGEELKISYIADGANYSDLADYRPGMKAVEEGGGHSPLMEVRLTKDEVRQLSREMDLETWDKPASPCLASRIPYGTKISAGKLSTIAKAEGIIKDFGVKNVRVRHENKTARIEVNPEEISTVFENKDEISRELKKFGYLFVALDLDGYYQGNLNKEAIKQL